MVLMCGLSRSLFRRSIIKYITLTVWNNDFNFTKIFCNWSLYWATKNILKFSYSTTARSGVKKTPLYKGLSLLSGVKFHFNEISHLTFVSMCIKDENISKQLHFCQSNSFFGKRVYGIYTPIHSVFAHSMY